MPNNNDPTLLTLPGNNWKSTVALGPLDYTFLDSTNPLPTYYYTNLDPTQGFSSQYRGVGAPQPLTVSQQELISYYLSDPIGTATEVEHFFGFPDVQFRDSYPDVANISFQASDSPSPVGAIFISNAALPSNPNNTVPDGATEPPSFVNTLSGNGSTAPLSLPVAPPPASDSVSTVVYLSESGVWVAQAPGTYTIDTTNATIQFPGGAPIGVNNIAVQFIDSGGAASGLAGDVLLNPSGPAISSLNVGQSGALTILHELGHALGLIHADNGDGGTDPNAGFTGIFKTDKYTIMSSNLGLFDPDVNAPGTAGSGLVYATGLQLYDIAAIQSIYGYNNNTRVGDTTYTVGLTAAGTPQAFGSDPSKPFLYTIWDGGGTNTIDASPYTTPVEIDLRQGNFSSIGVRTDGTPVPFDAQATADNPDPGNVAIAYHTLIQNAIGGSGNDVLIGNSSNNVLTAGTGNDYLFGNGVVYDGNPGFAAIDPNDPNDPNRSIPTQKHDILIGGPGNDIFMPGAGLNSIVSGGLVMLDGNGNVTSSAPGGNATDIIYMSAANAAAGAPDVANAVIGYADKTAIVSNSVSGEISTNLYNIQNVVAEQFNVKSYLTVENSPDLTGGLTVQDFTPDQLNAYQSGLSSRFTSDNVFTTSPIQQITSGDTVSIGTTTVGNFYNFGTFIGTPGNDTFNFDQVLGRSVTGNGGFDTVDYSGLTAGIASGLVVTTTPTSTIVQAIGHTGTTDPSDTLTSVDKVVGTSGADNFSGANGSFAETNHLVYQGGAGADTYTFNLASDRGLVEISNTNSAPGVDKLVIQNVSDDATTIDFSNVGSDYINLIFGDNGEGGAPANSDLLTIRLNKTAILNGTGGVGLIDMGGHEYSASKLIAYLEGAPNRSYSEDNEITGSDGQTLWQGFQGDAPTPTNVPAPHSGLPGGPPCEFKRL